MSQAVEAPPPGSPVSGQGQIELLKKWLSVAESQICALEVLSEELPHINTLLEENMMGISTEFSDVATLLKRQQEKFEAAKASAGDNITPEMQDFFNFMTASSEQLDNSVGNVIVGMQFQDRVSQNVVITINVMKAVIRYLRDVIDETITTIEEESGDHDFSNKTVLDKEFAKQVITMFNLGELKNSFVQHLLDHHYINDPSELDHDMTDSAEDLELF